MKWNNFLKGILAVVTIVSTIPVISIVKAEFNASWILEPTAAYDTVHTVFNGYASVYKGDKCGMIDSTGNLLFDMRVGNIDSMSEPQNGIILFCDAKDNKYKFLNLKGETILKAYDRVFRHDGGYLLVENEICSYVDKKLSLLVPPNSDFKYIKHMTKDLCLVQKSNDKYQIYKAGTGLIGRE